MEANGSQGFISKLHSRERKIKTSVMVLDAYGGQEGINSYFLLTEYIPLIYLL
jgi:hypothetical protein